MRAGPAALTGEPVVRRIIRSILIVYMRAWHGVELLGAENVPAKGPAIALVNHASLLDVPTLMALDKFPDTAMVGKASLFRNPILRWLLNQWGAIAVEREGRDTASLRRMLGILREGRVLAIAAEGRRSRNGHLGSINPVLSRFATMANVPILPIGIGGSFAALPPGARFPRRRKIVVRVGRQFTLTRGDPGEVATARIQSELAALLPADQQPLP